MNNFIFELQAIFLYMRVSSLEILRNQIVWGFSLGILVSTCIHAIVVTDNPRNIPQILTKSLPKAFDTLVPREKDGTYTKSYTDFQTEHTRVRTIFLATLIAFLTVLAISVVRLSL